MSEQVRTMLADLVASVPVRVDVERQVAAGRRRVRQRRLLSVGGTAAGVAGALAATAVLAGPSRTPHSPAATATVPASPTETVVPGTGVHPHPTPTPSRTGMPPIRRSTATSRALLAQLRQLSPVFAGLPRGSYSDTESFYPDAPAHRLFAGVLARSDDSDVMIDATIDPRDLGVEVCDPARPGSPDCTDVRHLPGGATAYLRSWTDDSGAPTNEVRVARPDGFDVWVRANSSKVGGGVDPAHPVPLTLEQVFDIARGITVRP